MKKTYKNHEMIFCLMLLFCALLVVPSCRSVTGRNVIDLRDKNGVVDSQGEGESGSIGGGGVINPPLPAIPPTLPTIPNVDQDPSMLELQTALGSVPLEYVRSANLHRDLELLNQLMSIVTEDVGGTDHFNKLQEFKNPNSDQPAYVTIGHEALHVLHQQVRTQELFAGKVGNETVCFFSLLTKGFCLEPTGLNRALIFDYLPTSLREASRSGSMSKYVIGHDNVSSDGLLVLFDEWVAYVEEIAIAINLYNAKDPDIRQPYSTLNSATMTMYNIAGLALIHDKNPQYLKDNKTYLIAFKYFLERFFSEVDRVTQLKMSSDDLDGSRVNQYFRNIYQPKDEETSRLREVLVAYFGQDWFDRTFNR